MIDAQGCVKSAELCAPLKGVHIYRRTRGGKIIPAMETDVGGEWALSDLRPHDTVLFKKEGFVSKSYPATALPQLVRLLEDRPIAYQDKLWFRPGEEVAVYAYASQPFSAHLYRHGLKKNHVLDLGRHQSAEQTVPDGHFVESGLDWEETLRYRIPSDANPGLYSLLLETPDQEPFAVPMIVSTPARKYGKRSRLLVLASTNTWQTYNLWGGRSRYRNFEDGGSEDFLNVSHGFMFRFLLGMWALLPSKLQNAVRKMTGRTQPAWKFKKLTIRRPCTNCRLEEESVLRPFTNHLAGGEWRLLAWLEREGIPYDIVSGYDFHQAPNLLANYSAIILSTHCEYWSKDMYRGLKEHHEKKGLWILNVSGNSIYRGIDFFDDGSIWCSHYFFHRTGEDETRILGVRFTDGDYGTCAPYRVLRPEHWVFQDVPLNKNTLTFGSASLNQNTLKTYRRYDPGRPGSEHGLEGMGASGWETDKLSKQAPKDIVAVAKGLNKHGGADMVVRDPQGMRGGLFSASSVTFSGSLLIDAVCSKILKNVLGRALG